MGFTSFQARLPPSVSRVFFLCPVPPLPIAISFLSPAGLPFVVRRLLSQCGQPELSSPLPTPLPRPHGLAWWR